MFISWDTETCPLPMETFTPAQTRKFHQEFDRLRRLDANLSDEELSVKVRSLNPFLGWICCVSAVRVSVDDEGLIWGTPKSWVAARPSEEEAILDNFWSTMRQVRGLPWWTTFNGKFFDVPFLRIRTLTRGHQVTRQDLMNTNPYNNKPHLDLINLFPHLSLEAVCELLNIETPKGSMDGSQVWPAVQAGDLEAVRQYCEADTVATMRCFLKSKHAAL